MAASYKTVVDQVLFPVPAIYTNLKQPYDIASFRVDIVGPDGEAYDSIDLTDAIYPFYTVSDLMALIYENRQDDQFHPIFQALLLPQDTSFVPLHIQHKKLNVRGSTVLTLKDPFAMVQEEVDDTFIDLAGNKSTRIESTSLMDVMLETILFRPGQKEYVVHLYLYSDVLGSYTGERRPIGSKDWFGRFAPLFPLMNRAKEDGTLPEELSAGAATLFRRIRTKGTLIQNLDSYLQSRVDQEENQPLLNRILGGKNQSEEAVSAKLRNYKYLRFAWLPLENKELYEPIRLETIFYEMPVSTNVPYMRFWPKTNSPLSKVHVDQLNRPSIEKPEILLEWAGKKTQTLTPEEDCLMIKILLKKGEGSINPIYATLYMFEDGSAKLILQPNKESLKLSTRGDLANLGELLDTVLNTVPLLQPLPGSDVPQVRPFLPSQFQLEDCYALLDLPIDPSERLTLTEDWFRDRLLFFAPFFQLTTSPIQEQNPIVFLRYKLMDNFRIPSRDFQFLHRALDLLKLSGGAEKQKKQGFDQLVEFYAREYTVSEEIAKSRVLAYYKEMTDKEKFVSKETVTFRLKTNPGLDIALFKENRYVFHLYRINSIEALLRIKTLLSLMLTADLFDEEAFPPESLASAEKYIRKADTAEEREADLAAADERGEEDEGADLEVRAAAVADAALGEENAAGAAFAGDDLEGLNFPEPNAGEEGGAGVRLEDLAEEDAEAGEEGPEPEAAAPSPAGAAGDEEVLITDATQLKYLTPATYFGQRLLFYDRKLFSWSTKGSTSTKGYPGMCASNALKQPTVMNEADFQQMKKVYAVEEEEGRVQWVEYPIQKGKAKAAPPERASPSIKTEQITVLRYGTNLEEGEANYYICSTYWCIKDSLVILEQDFETAWDHTGSSPAAIKWRADFPNKLPKKGVNTCPFCGGGLVQKDHRKIYRADETVLERIKQKSGKQKRHSFIGFLTKKGLHPDGYFLPCCFTKDPDKENALVLEKHPAFKSMLQPAAKPITGVRPEEVFARRVLREEAGVGPTDAASPDLTFKRTLQLIENEYILKTDTATPLEVKKNGTPQLSILPAVADRFFAQRSIGSLVKSQHTMTKLLRDADNRVTVSGFLRMAVDNRKQVRADSFINAIAPYYGYTSSSKFKEDLKKKLIEPIFLQLNYGNTLFEFYTPEIQLAKDPSIELQDFAKAIRMPIKRGPQYKHEPTLERALKAYKAFESHFTDPLVIKEYRIFGQFLTAPGMFEENPNGLFFIVLEINEKNELRVRCPPYGVPPAAANKCDYAFLLHYTKENIWEPVFYTQYKEDESPERTNHFVFRREKETIEEESWPAIVKTRVQEFQTLCHSSGLGLYTHIEAGPEMQSVILPLSAVLSLETPQYLKKETPPEKRVTIAYVLRDLYNHVNGVVITTRGKLIVIPCIDDGILLTKAYDVQLDFRNTIENLASFQEVREWYSRFLPPLIQSLKGPVRKRLSLYTIQETAYRTLNPDTHASSVKTPLAQLGTAAEQSLGLYIPVAESPGVPARLYDMVPWLIDADILFGSKTPDASMQMSFQEFQEIFEHLRYTFSKWLALHPETKTQIEGVLFDPEHGTLPNRSIPYWKKRHLLHTLLGPIVNQWLSFDPRSQSSTSFRRIDCTVQTKETCDSRCTWKEGSKTCLLHTPNDYIVGKSKVNSKKLLIAKLIEELIQFPVQRNELLKNRVYEYERLKKPITIRDQYIVPESVPAWDVFLRTSWKIKEPEKKKFYEEFTAIREPVEEDLADGPPSPLPEEEENTPEGEGEGEAAPAAASLNDAEGEGLASPPPEEDAEGEGKGEDDEESPQELGEPPATVIAQFGGGLYWMPLGDEGNTLWDRLTMVYGLDEDELRAAGQVEDASSMTLETMKKLAGTLRTSIVQYDLTAPDPENQTLVVWAKDATGLKKEFFILVAEEDGTSGLLSSSTEVEDIKSIPFSKLKSTWKSIIAAKKEHQVEV